MEEQPVGTEKLAVDKSDLLLQNKIGSGSQGCVYRACDPSKDQRYAIKVMNLRSMSEKEQERLKGEIKSNFTLSEHVHYNYFPQFFGYWTDENQVYLVFELCEGNALEGIRKHRTSAASYSFAYILLNDVLKALQLLEDRKIIHRDLKPENILIDKGRFKICDLGLSRIIAGSKKMTTDVGNLMSRAPESYTQFYDCRTDIWSLGINVYWIALGTLPFGEQIRKLLLEKNIVGIKDIIAHQNFEVCLGPLKTKLLQIVSDMLQIDYQKRLRASELLSKYFDQTTANFPQDSSHDKQILHIFFMYLQNRQKGPENAFYLILILLIIDFNRASEFSRASEPGESQPVDKVSDHKKQICRRMRLNVFLTLQYILEAYWQSLFWEQVQLFGHFRQLWEVQLCHETKNRKKVLKTFANIREGLQMHEIRGIALRFPHVKEAVRLVELLNEGKQVRLWEIESLDIRLLRI